MGNKDTGQYTVTGILRYEWIFGKHFLAPGEPETSARLAERLDDRSDLHVLDVGSGLGGPAFYLASHHGARVTGVDYSREIHEISLDRLQTYELKSQVDFVNGDILEMDWEPDRFDVVWSRDTLLHIHDKDALFGLFHRWTAPGGQVLITDYARSAEKGPDEFEHYVEKSDYDLHSLEEYAGLLEEAGFSDVVAEDQTHRFIEILENDINRLQNDRENFCALFTPEDCDYLESRWELKLRAAKAGSMKWGWFIARG